MKQARIENARPRWNLDFLNHPGIAAAFWVEVGGRFSALNLLHTNCNVETPLGLCQRGTHGLHRESSEEEEVIYSPMDHKESCQFLWTPQEAEASKANKAYRKVHKTMIACHGTCSLVSLACLSKLFAAKTDMCSGECNHIFLYSPHRSLYQDHVSRINVQRG